MAVGTTLMTTPVLSLIEKEREDEGLQPTPRSGEFDAVGIQSRFAKTI